MKARLPQGMGKAPGMNNMIKQAQKMQEMIKERQEEIEQMTFDASSGGGIVKVEVSGKKEISSLTIAPEILAENDVEMLSDLIIAAVNEAMRRVEDYTSDEMDKITGAIQLPGIT